MDLLTIEILGNKVINAKWEQQLYNAAGEFIGYGLPLRRVLSPDSLVDRQFVENAGGELKAYADIAWIGIPLPEQSQPEQPAE